MMSRDKDREYQQRAETAMQMALAAPANERHVWVQVALLWQVLSHAKDTRAIAARPDDSKNRMRFHADRSLPAHEPQR